MTDQKPTGVFVRLPLTGEQLSKFQHFRNGGCEANTVMRVIGTPVTGGELEALGYVPEGPLWNGAQFGMRNLYRTTEDEVWPRAVTGLAEAQIAARDAEIAQLMEENERLKRKLKPQFFCSEILEESSMDTRESIVEEARDLDDELHAYTVFGMEGYAKTHTSHGFFDKDDKCHWFNTEQEALSAAKSLKGGAA